MGGAVPSNWRKQHYFYFGISSATVS
jgi:hypothetical protein